MDSLRNLIQSLKSLGFFARLFSWNHIKSLLVDAASDLQGWISSMGATQTENTSLKAKIANIEKDLDVEKREVFRRDAQIEKLTATEQELGGKISSLEQKLTVEQSSVTNLQKATTSQTIEIADLKNTSGSIQKRNEELKADLASITSDKNGLMKRNSELVSELAIAHDRHSAGEGELLRLREENTQLKSDDTHRQQEHAKSLATLTDAYEQIKADRAREMANRQAIELERLTQMKVTWSNHEDAVKNNIKTICSRHTVEYVDQVPFKGTPDNTLKICDEFIVLDAKSPANDDLDHFPIYLKAQAEKAIKYAKQESVKKDIFFVVPNNTLDVLEIFVYRMADYNVFVVAVDSLEPLILALKKIEEYEFAEQLSPEERENICRILGKFAHLSKRRIQVDTFFAQQFIELAYKSESDLPKDVFEKVVEFEKAEKLNPPTERRAKQIELKELEVNAGKIVRDGEARGIVMQVEGMSSALNDIPLISSDVDK